MPYKRKTRFLTCILTPPPGAGNFSKGHFSGHSPQKMPHWNSPLPSGIGRGDGVNEGITRLKI